MNKIIKVKLFTIILFGVITCKVFSSPFFPSLYVSGGLYTGRDTLSNFQVEQDSTKYSIVRKDSFNDGAIFTFGVSPNIPLPIIYGLRGQIEYQAQLGKYIKGNMIGFGIYYDLFKMIIPIIDPYIGVDFLYYNANIKLSFDNIQEDKEIVLKNMHINQALMSYVLGVGLNFSAWPIQLFGEYRYTTSSNFSSQFKFSGDGITINKADFNSFTILLGLKYYII